MQKKPVSCSKINYYVFLVIFFPFSIISLLFLYKSDKFNYVKNGRRLEIIGGFMIGLSIIFLFLVKFNYVGFTASERGGVGISIFVSQLIFGGGGIYALVKGISYEKRGKKYKKYVSAVNSCDDVLIENIASACQTTYDKALSDLRDMIGDGYFMNAYIDDKSRRLVVPHVEPQFYESEESKKDSSSETYEAEPKKSHSPRNVTCKNCGAPNIAVPGNVNICEYCGSTLNIDL